MNPIFRAFVSSLTLACALLPLHSQAAERAVKLTLAEPQWSFLIDNSEPASTDLAPAERSFARGLQPLLAARDYKAVAAQLSERKADDDSAALSLLRGQILLSLDDIKGAQQALEKTTRLAPQLGSAHRSLGLVYLQQQNYDKARTHLQKALELGERNAQLFGQLAFANLQLGFASGAVAGYQQALFLDAGNKEWARGLLYALTRAQALDQAQALVEELLQKEPDNAEFWLVRSQIALQQERPLQALSSLESAIALGEKKPENLSLTAQLHLTSGSPERAVELLTRPQVLNAQMPVPLQNTLVQTANWLAQEQQWSTLKTLLSQAQGKNLPELAAARLAVSRAHLALHNDNKGAAEKALRDALNTDPTLGDALMALADLLRDQQRHQQAALYYVRAEALPDYRERALLGRAQLEINQRNFAAALPLLSQVVRDNPARTDLYASIRSLRNLVRNDG
ncbi:tetratricopeptide repeat protein [Thalassolituus sp. LLYu03]|uniref:tetratricopeptide repeat protein n=1 Tax=Thalassolituus sp. LLYu03 TaxID=3421656 RepID=UPI003D2900DB